MLAGAESKEEVFCVVNAAGVSALQCCCWGLLGDGSVCAAQWLRGSVSIIVAVCVCVSLDDDSVLHLWLSKDSWTITSVQ